VAIEIQPSLIEAVNHRQRLLDLLGDPCNPGANFDDLTADLWASDEKIESPSPADEL